MAEITTSLDWDPLSILLDNRAKRLGRYSPEMLQISNNIGNMVKELGKEEINCRRHGRQTRQHQELLTKINTEIHNFEVYLTFGTLLND
jgi:hypothetical protein